MGKGVCDSCRGVAVIVGENELVRVSDLDHCPFALDYTQEQYIIEVFVDRNNNRLTISTGELPQWLYQGMRIIDDWQEANKEQT